MLEIGLIAFSTFFATIAPVDVAAVYPAITPDMTERRRRAMAIKGVAVATGVLLAFALFGNVILQSLGITLPALRIAGGILLMLMAIDMVFARASGGVTATAAETEEAERKRDISVFPLATPLIAGPGAMGAAVLLTAEAEGDLARHAVVAAALLAVLLITLVLLLLASRMNRFLGRTCTHVVTRVVGILLAGLAVQFVIDGIKGAGLLT